MEIYAQPKLPWTPTEKLCYSVLQHNTTTIRHLLRIHAFIIRNALDTNVQLFTLLLSSLSCHRHLLNHVRLAFHHRPLNVHDTFLCNIVIKTHDFSSAISLYNQLGADANPHRRFYPNSHTFTLLLKSIPSSSVPFLRQIQTHVLKMGFFGDPFVVTMLVDVYGKFGDMGSARKVFDGMWARSSVVWTSMFAGYVRKGDVDMALQMFERMPEKDIVTFNAMIDVLVKLGDARLARRVFDEMPDRNVVSWSNLLSGYCKIGDLNNARRIFDQMPEKNVVSWNTMISRYCRNGKPKEALDLFRELQMRSYSVEPDDITLVSVLPAVADLGAIDVGRWIHGYAQKKKLDSMTKIGTALIDMYAKCGHVDKAEQIFLGTGNKETTSWNAMINGFAINGYPERALELFAEMQGIGAHPSEVTIVAVLSACSHGGLVEQGMKIFKEMEAHQISRAAEHYGCMVDLLARAGYLQEAENLIKTMPYEPNGIMLSSLLFACGMYGDVERAERVMEMAGRIEPANSGNYVIMRNLYVGRKMWNKVEEMKVMMLQGSVTRKETGCSVVEVENRVWEFVSGDQMQLQPIWDLIEVVLRYLRTHMEGQESLHFSCWSDSTEGYLSSSCKLRYSRCFQEKVWNLKIRSQILALGNSIIVGWISGVSRFRLNHPKEDQIEGSCQVD